MEGKLTPQKRKWFKALAIAMPLFICFLAELILRLSGYGHDTSLFIRYPDDTSYWVMNKYASDRFFSDTANATKGSIELFKVRKQPNTCRIFVLGESTTAGYPYFHNGSFHRWLKFRLLHTYPGINFEIINLSLTAVNSYTVLDFGKEVTKYQPDAVLIYVGHNEYYGALGTGSTSHIANNRFLVQLVLTLRKQRLVQLIANGISLLRFKGETDTRQNLMERMAETQKIPYQSQQYIAGIQQFADNMDELCRIMQERHIPVFLSTLVSNEKDLKPFISGPCKSGTADHLFEQAKAAYWDGDFRQAKAQFDTARELDMLRFRAPEGINKTIIRLSQKYPEVHLVDTRTYFEQHSPHGIVGHESLLEHVHPNLCGYAWLSDVYYQTIEKAHLIAGHPDKEMSFDELLQKMPITQVDSLNGLYTIMMLETGWPFNKPIPRDFKRGNTEAEQLAGALTVNRISWLDAIDGLFQYSMQARDKKTALKAVEAALLEFPQNTTYQVYAGRLCFEVGRYDDAVYYFKRLYDSNNSTENAENLIQVLLKTDQPEKALAYVHSAMQLPASSPYFSGLDSILTEIIQLKHRPIQTSGIEEARQQIAARYHQLGADEAAEKYFK